MSSNINTAILRLKKRAETNDRAYLTSTFVDVGPLYTLLSNGDNQILFGRRGTGKTHVLNYLADSMLENGDAIIQIDMRTIGSSGGIYSDPNIPITERATRLLVDTLSGIHEGLVVYAIDNSSLVDLSVMGPALDNLADSITQVTVIGTIEREESMGEKQNQKETTKTGIDFKSSEIAANMGIESTMECQTDLMLRRKRTGVERPRVHFGSVGRALSNIMKQVAPKNAWILLDEWSEIPLDLQPYLADLLRRTIFPVQGIIVKIAAIEQRCEFRVALEGTGYIGIELGADAATSLNLDEFMVFDNDTERAKQFFAQLLFKHVKSTLAADSRAMVSDPNDLIRQAFTQSSSFDEWVRAAEGVPRDAFNILAQAAQRANENRISIPDIRIGAKTWYSRSKESVVTDKLSAQLLLRWIIDEVIAHRQARAFLLRSDAHHELIDYLFDARVIHVVKQGVSSHDQPGVRFNVYTIDYGCYVDLINTTKAPRGLFEIEDDEGLGYVDVPNTDYRSIRRAILSLTEFQQSLAFISA